MQNNTDTTPLFEELHILPSHQLITFNKLILMHSIIYGHSPDFFTTRGQLIENFGPIAI
jgi:hypothetical protein